MPQTPTEGTTDDQTVGNAAVSQSAASNSAMFDGDSDDIEITFADDPDKSDSSSLDENRPTAGSGQVHSVDVAREATDGDNPTRNETVHTENISALRTPLKSNLNSTSILKAASAPGETQELEANARRGVSFGPDPDNSGGESMDSYQSFSDTTSMDSAHVHRQTGTGERPGLGLGDAYQRESRLHIHRSNRRVSLTTDLETGKSGGGVRLHEATIRSQSECRPQNETARRRKGIKKAIVKVKNRLLGDDSDDSADDNSISSMSVRGRLVVSASHVVVDNNGFTRPSPILEEDEEEAACQVETQYTLKAKQTLSSTRTPFGQNVMYEVSPSQEEKSCSFLGIRPNMLVHAYLNWAFRETFMKVFLSAAIIFFSMTGAFAVLIFWSGRNKPECIHVNGVEFGSTGADFMDAYALSWTTFSTVGYGLVYPSTSSVHADVHECTGITVLTTLESFIGILYASFCGAIMFAKVTRIASFAQVTFSDPIVIRYGSGIAAEEEEDEAKANGGADDSGTSKDFSPSKLPCPLLEFRIVNRLAGQLGGEIIDASINIVASIDEKQADHLNTTSIGRRKGGKKGKRRIRLQEHRRSSAKFNPPSKRSYDRVAKSVRNMFASSLRQNQNQAIVEDPTGKVVPRRVFAKMEIDSAEHPFFKRLWLIRHVLNESSPLLKRQARNLVRANGGHWPQELNTADRIRASIDFNQILVSLSGTSNIDANSVYAQKAYDFVDICVGYRFCNILFRNEDGTLGVDQSLLNDVTEQVGGGGEVLTDNAGKHYGDLFTL